MNVFEIFQEKLEHERLETSEAYHKYFRKKGIEFSEEEGHVVAVKSNGDRVRITNPVSYVELFDALERFARLT